MYQPTSLKQECDNQKYNCCKIVKKIYSLMEKPWIPQLLKYKTEPPKENIIPQNVQEFLIKKKDNPQYIRTSIKYEHASCLYELLRFDFDTYLALKTTIRFDRFYLIDLFLMKSEYFLLQNGERQWATALNYITIVPSLEQFSMLDDDRHDETIKIGFADDEKREQQDIDGIDRGAALHELTYTVLCGSHKTLSVLLASYQRADKEYEEACYCDEENPLHLSIIKGDLYSAKMLYDKNCPSYKRFFDKYIQTCSTEQKEQIESFIVQLELNKDPRFYTE
jgi:hypothetical protein